MVTHHISPRGKMPMHYNHCMGHSDHLPQDIPSLIKEGSSLLSTREGDSAKAIFDDVLARDPSCAEALCGRGAAFCILGQFEEAIRDFDAALALEPKYAQAVGNRGLARFHKGEIQEAITDMSKAIELDPESGFYYDRADCFSELGKYDLAASDLDTCIELDPEQAGAYFERGVAFSRQGKTQKAILDFEEAIRRNWRYPQVYGSCQFCEWPRRPVVLG